MNKFNHASAGFKICVDTMGDYNFSGRVYSQRLLEPFLFDDIRHLIMKIEFILDKQNFPKAYEQKRSFNSLFVPDDVLIANCIANGMDKSLVLKQRGKISTFDLYVITRRNTTWQGYIVIEDKKIEFNSVMEFFKIINI